uniref:Cysteine-rich membrane protein 2 n=1 Tax=Spironucleus salmonicida TaxID=348837 RepID=V6LMC7_9EUKA|eukprot:EST45847.1 Cysteine-rich membrane protein 2 [Spironucleus salmonicida]
MNNCTIPNCKECMEMPDSVECMVCEDGYLILGTQCTSECPDSHFQKEGVCTLCNVQLSGCSRCDITGQICNTCIEGFVIIEQKCVCNLQNCKLCDFYIENQCKQCNQYYYLDELKTCVHCSNLPNCLDCQSSHVSTHCTQCQPKYTLDQTEQCVPCSTIINCKQCSIQSEALTCSGCESGFQLNNNECEKMPDNCSAVTESNICTKCNDGFALNTANACGACDAIIDFASPACACGVAENCGNCGKDLDACGACLGSFEMKDGKCVQGACAVANCETCRDRPDSCMACAGGFQLTILDSCQESCAGVGENGQFCRAGAARAAEWVACPADATGVAQMLTDCICGSAENCGNCSADGQCGACLPGYQQRNGSCTECADGFLRQPSNGLCVKKTEEASNKLSTGEVAGIVIGVLVVVGVISGVVVFQMKKKHSTVLTSEKVAHQND